MRLYQIIWKDQIVHKLAYKHAISPEEVEDALFSQPHFAMPNTEKSQAKTFTRRMEGRWQDGISSSFFSANHIIQHYRFLQET